VILIENVVGFTRGRGSALNVISWALDDINQREGTNYNLVTNTLNAADFGVPQRRERAILVALRDGSAFDWPAPAYSDLPVRSWDAIGGLRERETPVAIGKWAGLLPSIPEGWNYLWHTDRGGGRPLFGYRTRYWSFLLKLAKAEPAWTIPAQPGPATGPFHWDNRPLSVREMLRLQTFPTSWTVLGDYPAQVRQVGNATPPLLAEVIARRIAEQAFAVSYANPPRLRIPRRRSIPGPTSPSAVPRQYLEWEGAHPAHPGTGRGPRPVVRLHRLAA
jgi:DNA (cytosine-5)-methyltransferase 1